MSLVDSPHHCLLSVTFVDLHQACPGGVVASFPAHPEFVHIRVLTLAHSALKAVRKGGERRGELLAISPSSFYPPTSDPQTGAFNLSDVMAKFNSEYLLNHETTMTLTVFLNIHRKND